MDEVGAVLVTGAIAAIIAVWGVLSQRVIAKRRTTLDHIVRLQTDHDVIAARKIFIELAKKEGGLAIWASEDKEQTEEAQAIRLILNDFELTAIGIQRAL
jgi:hypothetical protein